MTEPQVWTLIGVLGAALFGMITLITQFTTRTLSVQIGALHNEMVLRFERVDEKFERVDEKFDMVDERFGRLEGRMDRLEGRFDKLEGKVADIERDLQAISRRVFPE